MILDWSGILSRAGISESPGQAEAARDVALAAAARRAAQAQQMTEKAKASKGRKQSRS